MIKLSEVNEPDSCLNRAFPDEMLFVLMARDAAAPAAIRAWIAERIRLGLNTAKDTQIKQAASCVEYMQKTRPVMREKKKAARNASC